MATLANLQTDLSLKLNDQNARILTAAQCYSLINRALEEWCNRTEEVWDLNAYALTAYQFYYTAPTDLIRPISARNGKLAYAPLEVVNSHEFEQAGGYDLNHGAGTPIKLLVEGKNAAYLYRIFPPPSSSGSSTTTNGAITALDTTITVTDVTQLRSPAGWVQIESEKICYQNVSTANNQLLLCKRGMGGTTAASHTTGKTVTECDLFVTYSRRPAALTVTGDVPEIDGRYHYYLIYHALANALELDGRDGSKFFSLWERKVQDAKREISRNRGAAPSFILEGGY